MAQTYVHIQNAFGVIVKRATNHKIYGCGEVGTGLI